VRTTSSHETMPVNSTHPEYDASAAEWLRARNVLAGEDAVKAAGERYLPRLDSQTDDELAAYRRRASFFNATARTADGYIGLIFRRPPFVKLPEDGGGMQSTSTGPCGVDPAASSGLSSRNLVRVSALLSAGCRVYLQCHGGAPTGFSAREARQAPLSKISR